MGRKSQPAGEACKECAMGSSVYIPCGRTAEFIIDNRGEITPMCWMCANHNVKNRGAKYVTDDLPDRPELDQMRSAMIGDNSGLRKGEDLNFHLATTYAELTKRTEDLIAAEARMPEISTPKADEKATEFVKQIQACVKAMDLARVGEKEPYDTAGDAVHAFFRGPMDKLTAPTKNAPAGLKERVQARQTKYKLAVAEAERKRREAEAEFARQEESRRRAAAAEAERLAQEAERAAARKRNEGERLKAEALATAARERAAETAEAERVAAETRAAADRSAGANLADLSRARGATGGVSSLRTFWNFRDMDRATLDLEALRSHIPTEALEQAVRAAIKAGTRTLKGVVIFEDANTTGR